MTILLFVAKDLPRFNWIPSHFQHTIIIDFLNELGDEGLPAVLLPLLLYLTSLIEPIFSRSQGVEVQVILHPCKGSDA